MKIHQERLYGIAEGQRGFFTTKQAVSCGYVSTHHPYHVRTGSWIREYRGIYRLAAFPRTPEDQYALWSLWSRGRDDRPMGVYSHQTALSLHELSDVMPRKLHMTVPPGFRRNAEIPKLLVLHKGIVQPQDVEERDGYRVVAPLRAVLDLLNEGTEDRTQLQKALREAVDRGLITKRQIELHPDKQSLLELMGKGRK